MRFKRSALSGDWLRLEENETTAARMGLQDRT
jgi:hypothetical protein